MSHLNILVFLFFIFHNLIGSYTINTANGISCNYKKNICKSLGTITITHKMFQLKANSGVIHFDKENLKIVYFKNNVQFFHQDIEFSSEELNFDAKKMMMFIKKESNINFKKEKISLFSPKVECQLSNQTNEIKTVKASKKVTIIFHEHNNLEKVVCNFATYNKKHNKIYLKGNIKVQEKSGYLKGELGTINLDKRTVKIHPSSKKEQIQLLLEP